MNQFDENNDWEDVSAPATSDAGEWEDVSINQPTAETKPQVGYGESAVRGAVQGLTGKFSDELVGGAKAALTAIGSEESLLDRYTRYRDEERAKNQSAKEANPLTYGGADIAGGVTTALLVPGGQATALARIGTAAAQGGAMALGASEADLTKGEFKDAAIDTAIGAGAGALFSGGVEGIRKGVNAVRGAAPDLAVKSLGGTNGQNAKLDPEQRRKLGQWLLDNKTIRFGRTAKDTAARAGAAVTKAGDDLGAVLNQSDELIDPSILSERLTKNVIEPAVQTNTAKALNAATGAVDDIASKEALTLNELNQLTSNISSNAYQKAGDKGGAALLRGIEREGDNVIREALPPTAIPQYNAANNDYGMAITAKRMADKGAAKLDTNKTVSITDWIMGAGALGASGGNPLVAAGTIAAKKAIRDRGAQSAAIGLDAVNKAMNNPAMQKFAPILRDAAARGSNQLALTHYLLSQRNPEYQKALQDSEPNSTPASDDLNY
jgi:hypothetical protein